MSDSLLQLFDSTNMGSAAGRDYTINHLLDQFSANMGNKLDGQPEAEAALRTTIGLGYRHLGEWAKAEKHLARALDLRRRVVGEQHEKYADSLVDYAWVLNKDRRRLPEAEKCLRQAREIYRARGVSGEPVLKILGLLQEIYLAQGRKEELWEAAEEEDAISIQTYGQAYLDSLGMCAGPRARETPARPEYVGFVGLYLKLSRELAATGRTREAEAANQKVRALLEELRTPAGGSAVPPAPK